MATITKTNSVYQIRFDEDDFNKNFTLAATKDGEQDILQIGVSSPNLRSTETDGYLFLKTSDNKFLNIGVI